MWHSSFAMFMKIIVFKWMIVPDVIEAHCYGTDKGSDRFSSGHVAGQ